MTKRALLTQWLQENLDQYGDTPQAIGKALDYASSPLEGRGGFVGLALKGEEILACSVVNHTGMAEYIPENQLVYLAVRKDHRGQGWGRKLLTYTLEHCPGAMALHVEHDNPARFLYSKLGFTNRYAEMRRPAGG